jgi:hypothetical protein
LDPETNKRKHEEDDMFEVADEECGQEEEE